MISQLLSMLCLLVIPCAKSQQSACSGVVSFEKISRRQPNPEKITSNGILFEEPGQAVTVDCLTSCLQQPACFGLTVDYSNSRCASFAQTPNTAADLLPSQNNFFEKVCYRDISLQSCGTGTTPRLWTIERSVAALLDGFIAKQFITTHRLGCSKQCLIETSFNCSSASYEQSTGKCVLSKENRRTQPQAYRDTYLNGTWTYMENHCAEPGLVCAYDRKKGKSVITVDRLVFAKSADHCEVQCRNESHFICRSFSFFNNRCFLSSDDRISSASFTLPVVPEATYGELVCSSDDCTDGKYLYEKVIGHILESGIEEEMTASLMRCESTCDRLGITCRSAALDYAKNMCYKLDRNSQGRSVELKPMVGRSYIEKNCLRMTKEFKCGGSEGTVAFIRIPGIEFESSFYSKTFELLVQSRQECQQKCFDESSFTCKSASYNEATTECKLSHLNLHSHPRSARMVKNANYKISHMENLCSYNQADISGCAIKKTADQRLIYADTTSQQLLLSDCEKLCRNQFTCRSFSYSPTTNQCFLSSVSSRIPDLQLTIKADGYDYFEFDCHEMSDSDSNISTTSTGNGSSSGSSYRTDMNTTTSSPVMTPLTSVSTDETTAGTDAANQTITTLQSGSSDTTTSMQPQSDTPQPSVPSSSTTVSTDSTVSPNVTVTTATEEGLTPTTTTTTTNLAVSGTPASVAPSTVTAVTNAETVPSTVTTKSSVSPSPPDPVDTSTTTTTTTTTATTTTAATTTTTAAATTTTTMTTTTTAISANATTDESGTSGSPSSTMNSETVPQSTNAVTGMTETITTASPPEAVVSPTIGTSKDPTVTTSTLDDNAITKDQTSVTPTLTTKTSSPTSTTRSTTTTTAATTTWASISAPTTITTKITTTTASSSSSSSSPNVTSTSVRGNFCPNNYEATYERMPGFEPIGNYFFTLLCGSQPSDPGIVIDCSDLCSDRSNCRGFVVDYKNHLCFGLISDPVIRDVTLCVSDSRDFYQRICVPKSLSCGNVFSFDRIPDQMVDLDSVIPRYTIPFITKEACKCLCLEEKKFTCRSISYEIRNSVCRIFDRPRIEISLTFMEGHEFYENLCASSLTSCSYIRPEVDVGPLAVIKSLSVRSVYECRSACDSIHSFHCRSFNFIDRIVTGGSSNLCLLYPDNQLTARKGSLKFIPRSLFYQRICT